jgi:hypothetical protein
MKFPGFCACGIGDKSHFQEIIHGGRDRLVGVSGHPGEPFLPNRLVGVGEGEIVGVGVVLAVRVGVKLGVLDGFLVADGGIAVVTEPGSISF